MAHVLVENRMIKTVRMQMAVEGIRKPDIFSVCAFFVAGVHADIAYQKVDQAFVVVVEEHDAGGMRGPSYSGFLGNVCEVPMAIVLKEHISLIHGRHKKILMTRVI